MGFPPGLLHSSGALLVDDSGLISAAPGLTSFAYANGLKLNNAGQLAVKLGGTVHTYNNGFPVTADGELCVTYLGTGSATPTLVLDFAAMGGVLDPRITYARTSNAWFFDATGNLVLAGPGVPRFAYDLVTLEPLGILCEIASTNTMPNNTAVGAVAGSPGTAPNLWVVDGNGNGLTRTIVGVGQENGIDYLDIKYEGVPVASTPISIAYVGINVNAATPAQMQCFSAFYRLMAGSTAGCVFNETISASDGTQLLGDVALPFVPTSAILRTQRVANVGSLTAFPTTTRVQHRLRVDVTAGAAINFTIRIGLPQTDNNAVLSSPIKTTVAGVGRIADLYTMVGANFTSWYSQGVGTLVAEYTAQSSVNTSVWAISDGTTSYEKVSNSLTSTNIIVVLGGVTQGQPVVATPGKVGFMNFKTASAWATNDLSISVNGVLSIKDVLCAMPVNSDRLNIGSAETSGSILGGIFKRLVYYPQRLDDAALVGATENTFHVGGVLVGNSAVRMINA